MYRKKYMIVLSFWLRNAGKDGIICSLNNKQAKTTITNEQTGTTNKSRQAKEKKHEQIYITQRYLSRKRMS